MIFICVNCEHEMDYNEGPNEIIECEECGGLMYAHPELEAD